MATIAIHPQMGKTILSPTPRPSAKQNNPIVFLNPPVNIFFPPLTNEYKYCKIFIIYYEICN